jgi:putative endonuclease
MATHNELGAEGEKLAADYLKEKGYRLLAKNWRSGRHELDIVASNESEIVFVEVKTRNSDYFGLPEESITKKKIRKTGLAAEAWIQEHPTNLTPRYDVIAILKNKERTQIEHFEDFFFPVLY